jgi:hypothetical protein
MQTKKTPETISLANQAFEDKKPTIHITAPQKLSGMLGIQHAQIFESHPMGIPLSQGKRHVPYSVSGMKLRTIERLSVPELDVDLPINLVSTLGKPEYNAAMMLGSGQPYTAQQIKRILKIAHGKPLYMVSLRVEFDVIESDFQRPGTCERVDTSKNLEVPVSFLNRAGINQPLNADESHTIYLYREVKTSAKDIFSSETKLPYRSSLITLEDFQSEESIALQAGLEDYIQLTLPKWRQPTAENVDSYIMALRDIILKAQTNDAIVWFHCKNGQTPSSLAQIMYDMMHNAQNDSFEELIKRSQLYVEQRDLGISISLLAYNSQAPEFYSEVLEKFNKKSSARIRPQLARLIFLKTFYDYVQQNPKGYPLTYSEFLSSSPVKEFFEGFKRPAPQPPHQAEPLIQLRALF